MSVDCKKFAGSGVGGDDERKRGAGFIQTGQLVIWL